jgi:hypothetical protein
MGAGHQFNIEAMRQKRMMIHPAWAGVGCFTIAGLSAGGYLLGSWFVSANAEANWIPLPPELAWPPQNPYLFVKVAIAILILLFGSTLFSIVYMLIRPPKPGRFDVIDPSIFPSPPRRMR